jgi:hypothetical protein
MTVENTLTYYCTELNMVVKRFYGESLCSHILNAFLLIKIWPYLFARNIKEWNCSLFNVSLIVEGAT